MTETVGNIQFGNTDDPFKRQVGGTHYQGFAISPLDFIMANKLELPEGCVIKYVCRHNKLGGKGKEDLEKAIHYLQCRIAKYYGG